MASALNSPVCFSALYFMNLRGEVLMERQYRDDVTRQMAAAFKTEIVNGKDRGNVPVVNLGSCTFMYKREQNVYIVAVTRANANAMLAFTFLGELVDLFKSYFGKFDENALKQNFVIISRAPGRDPRSRLPSDHLGGGASELHHSEKRPIHPRRSAHHGWIRRRGAGQGGFHAGHGRGSVACAGADVQEERGVSRHHRECVAAHVAQG